MEWLSQNGMVLKGCGHALRAVASGEGEGEGNIALVQGFGNGFRTVTAELHVKNGSIDASSCLPGFSALGR